MITEPNTPKKRRAAPIATPDSSYLLNEFVTTTTSGYLRDAVKTVEGNIGNTRHFNNMILVSGCMQSYATLHAAQLVASALNRNTEALKALTKTKSV